MSAKKRDRCGNEPWPCYRKDCANPECLSHNTREAEATWDTHRTEKRNDVSADTVWLMLFALAGFAVGLALGLSL